MSDNTKEHNCANCAYARLAYAPNMVACGLLSLWKHGLRTPKLLKNPRYPEVQVNASFSEYFNNMEFKTADVYEGWACLGSKPNGIRAGMMQNLCVIVGLTNCCENFEKENRI